MKEIIEFKNELEGQYSKYVFVKVNDLAYAYYIDEFDTPFRPFELEMLKILNQLYERNKL